MRGMSENGRLTLSTGVTLRVKNVAVATFGVIRTQMHSSRPKEPVLWLEEKGRDEPNPNDPDYIAALEDWEERLSTRLLEAAIVLGTETDTVPEDFPRPEDAEWASKFDRIGVPIPTEPEERYLAWLKHCAAPTLKDIQEITLATAREIGVTEEDAAEAAASFRGDAEQ